LLAIAGYNNGESERDSIMKKYSRFFLYIVVLSSVLTLAGCLERQLTVKTNPTAALVELNDEEIGVSPVTVNFNWYGDYNVRISKEGYETLKTHRQLKGPWYDSFPFDFFAQILSAEKKVDKYEWTFELEPKKEVNRDQLIQDALKLKGQL
jgi:hypothetical protein